MIKRVVWFIVSCLMVLTLVLASCEEADTGGTVTTEDQGQTVTVGGEEDVATGPGTATTAGEEQNRPQYGGRLTFPAPSAPTAWNPGAVVGTGAGKSSIVLEQKQGRNREECEAG